MNIKRSSIKCILSERNVKNTKKDIKRTQGEIRNRKRVFYHYVILYNPIGIRGPIDTFPILKLSKNC